jgi:hypothetical protein
MALDPRRSSLSWGKSNVRRLYTVDLPDTCSVNSTSFGWLSQVEHFGRLPQYSVLVFDNRGVGMSGTPKGPYTCVSSWILADMCIDPFRIIERVAWLRMS